MWRWSIKLTLTEMLSKWWTSTDQIQSCKESDAADMTENEGSDVWGKEEMFCTPCPQRSGYKRVEDPLWTTRRFERAKGSRDHTSQPCHGCGAHGLKTRKQKKPDDLTI